MMAVSPAEPSHCLSHFHAAPLDLDQVLPATPRQISRAALPSYPPRLDQLRLVIDPPLVVLLLLPADNLVAHRLEQSAAPTSRARHFSVIDLDRSPPIIVVHSQVQRSELKCDEHDEQAGAHSPSTRGGIEPLAACHQPAGDQPASSHLPSRRTYAHIAWGECS